METRCIPFGDEAISEAARLILAGKPVTVPTETVYGLAADATNGAAVARIYQAKGRPSFNPLIIHVASLEQAESHAEFDDLARSRRPGRAKKADPGSAPSPGTPGTG